MKRITATKGVCLFHKWQKVANQGGYVYSECHCGARKVDIPVNVPKQSIRFNWLSGDVNKIKKSPTKKGVNNG